MLICARVAQGAGAALMMPTAIAIVSAAYPSERRGQALGILAGASAFFAALGPVLGGVLTSIDWRLVFLINVVLAAITIAMTLRSTPDYERKAGAARIDWAGTVNDPTGLSAVPAESRGQAAGTISTTEQLGGAIGIAGLTAVELGSVEAGTESRLEASGIDPTPAQIERFREFILEAEQSGLRDAPGRNRPLVERALNDSVDAHVAAFQDVFLLSAGIALLGALACVVLVRKTDRSLGPVFGRRSRCVYANVGVSPGLTRHLSADEGRGR